MKDYKEQLQDVKPEVLIRFLVSHGWELDQYQKHGIVMKKAYKQETTYVTVAVEQKLARYPKSVFEVLQGMEEVEGVPIKTLLRELTRKDCNVVKFRYRGQTSSNGVISIDDSIRIREARKKLLLAAAHAVTSPQKNYSRLSKSKPVEFVKNCQERPPEAGSYVSEVVIPSTLPKEKDNVEQLDFWEGVIPKDEPYPRQVLIMLKRLLVMSHKWHEGDDFDLAGEEGVSSNFLEALAELHPPKQAGALEISFDWSYERKDRPDTEHITLRDVAFDSFGRVAKDLKETEPVPNTELEGYVARMGKKDAKQIETEGKINLTTYLDGRMRSVGITLEPNDHKTAMRAYEESLRVVACGVLRKKGIRYYLNELEFFRILEDGNEQENALEE